MLFPYKPVPHAMESMHKFVDFVFREVWCKAPELEYSIELYRSNQSLFDIMSELARQDLADKLAENGAASFFYTHVNAIFNEFKRLSRDEIAVYLAHFDQNNDLTALCELSEGSAPVRYGELDSSKPELNKKIESFFSKLYSSGFFDLALVKQRVGSTIGEYYRSFVARGNSNDLDVCPFCGILPIDGEYDPTRDAFDHYLPKSKYPFNSVNLRNLCPSCSKCNSDNKRTQDPIHDRDGNRRKAFYPFRENEPDIQCKVLVKTKNWRQLRDADIEVKFESATQSVETATWQELYRIPERYAAKCCSQNGGLNWLKRVIDESHNYEKTPQEMFVAEMKSATNSPWVDCNFLKKSFLQGCDEMGLFCEQRARDTSGTT